MRWRKRTGFSGAFPRRERDSLWPSERRELSQGGGCPMAATPQVYRGPRMRNPVTRGLEHQTGNLVPEIMDKGTEGNSSQRKRVRARNRDPTLRGSASGETPG